jgi:hypothetical protein
MRGSTHFRRFLDGRAVQEEPHGRLDTSGAEAT